MNVDTLNDCQMGILLDNDSISSLRIGPGVRAVLCKDYLCSYDFDLDVIEIVGPYNIGQMNDNNDWIS